MAELHEGLFSHLNKLNADSDDISSKGNRRRSQKERELYIPGSGPLKKSENCDEETAPQQTPPNKPNKRNQKSEGSKEDKTTNINENRSQGNKKDQAQQSAQNDKRSSVEKNNSKNSNGRNDLNSKDAKNRRASNVSQSHKTEPPGSKEPRSDFENKAGDAKQKNKKPDSQIYMAPKPLARTSNSTEQLSDLSKESQGDPSKNNKTFPKVSKYKANNFRNESNKNFPRPPSNHEKKRSQNQKFSKENEDTSARSNPKGNDDSYRNKPFRDGRNRNYSHSSCDDSLKPLSSFPANKLPQTVHVSEPGNKPSNSNNSGTNSTNLSSNYNNKPENNPGYPAAQDQEYDVSKNKQQFPDPKSSQPNLSHGVNRNAKNSEPASLTDGSWPTTRNVAHDRRHPPGGHAGYDRGHSFRRNSDRPFKDRGPVHGRGHFPGAGPVHEANHNRGPLSGGGPAQDRGSPSERVFDRTNAPDNLPSQTRVHIPDRGQHYERRPESRYPPSDRGRHLQDRVPSSLNKGPVADQGYNKDSISDLRHPQNQQLSDRGLNHDEGISVDRNPVDERHENKLATDMPPRNDRMISQEQNSVPERDRFPDRNVSYDSGPGPDQSSFSFDQNPAPPLQNWNRERNLPAQGWESNHDRSYSHGRGTNFVRSQYHNAPQSNRRPIEKGPLQDFNPRFDMPPPHDGPPPMMSQGPPSYDRPNRDRMSNKPPMHKNPAKNTFTAPRFQKQKAMEENLKKSMHLSMNHIGTTSDYKWDGSSVSYSNSRESYSNSPSSLPPHFAHPPPPPYNQQNQYSQPQSSGNWAPPHALPNSKHPERSSQYMDAPDRKFMNERSMKSVTSERMDQTPGLIRTNLLNKRYVSNDNWKSNETYRSDKSWEQSDERSSDNSRRDRRLLSQSDTSSVDYQGKTTSRNSFSSDHSEQANINGYREDSSEEEDEDEQEGIRKIAVPDSLSMNWADLVDKNDDELNEPFSRSQDQCEPVHSPIDRNVEKQRRRRKKRRCLKLTTRSLSQERDLSRRRDSNISGSRQDVRYARNESLERKEWGRQKPMGNDRNRRRDNAGGGWNGPVPAERPFHRDRDRDRGGRDKRNRNRSSKRGMDKHRDRERSERDPENWRARNDSTSDSKPDYEPRSRDEAYRMETVRKEPDAPKCPSVGGILVLPTPVESAPKEMKSNFSHPHQEATPNLQSKQLFNYHDPNKPITVPLTHTRPAIVPVRSLNTSFPDRGRTHVPQSGAGNSGSASSKPAWYDPTSESFRSVKHVESPRILLDIGRADLELQWLLSVNVVDNWLRITELRKFLENALEHLLVFDLKFCEAENIECHIWKITYHNLTELLRKLMMDNPEQRDVIRNYLLEMIEQGTEYFKRVLNTLEETYKIKFDGYSSSTEKLSGLPSIALISAQKLFIFLGDLARYKEQVNETTNYGSARAWYLKAREMNPKNGKPYNQLALIAFCSKRKIDAVYYYMRSLMASNPIQSAKESLLSIFDVNRKKYESIEKKRMEDREKKNRDKAKEKESFNDRNKKRREIWIRPDDGSRKQMTLTTKEDSEDEELSLLSHIEVNKRFGVSFLHIQGKLFNKIGMESFQDAAHQMLREFRALLQHSPMALNVTRFLQLLALNMFAIENNKLKDDQLGEDHKSVQQELALMVSLQMFNIILERAIQLLKDQFSAESKGSLPPQNVVGSDLEILLPAIKVWCDWLMCHGNIWNPPPSCRDYLVGPASTDCWSRLATLTNYIDKLNFKDSELIVAETQPEDSVLVSLPEDSLLSGFSPLISPYQTSGSTYTSKSGDLDLAQMNLRIKKVHFFTTTYLCGLEPPVLKLQKCDSGRSEYISIVADTSSRDQSDTELCTESMSEEEDCQEVHLGDEAESESATYGDENLENNSPTKETRNLLMRKEHLEREHQKKEQYEQQVNAILEQYSYSVEMEVKPKYLVPDTNCFIDYLVHLRSIAKVTTATNENLYSLMVPLIVQNELQHLARGVRKSLEVADSAKEALEFLSQSSSAIKCVTTKGTILPHASNFTEEDDSAEALKNDDKILETCINLCKNKPAEEPKEGEPRKIHRNVVLLTDDRNLRVKALSRDMPVRKVPDFIRWAGLG